MESANVDENVQSLLQSLKCKSSNQTEKLQYFNLIA